MVGKKETRQLVQQEFKDRYLRNEWTQKTFKWIKKIFMCTFNLLAKLKKQSDKSFLNSKARLPNWIHQFLADEEKAAILIDYRVEWYRDKRHGNWTHFKIWIKTMHYLFYEVWFKDLLYRISLPDRRANTQFKHK